MKKHYLITVVLLSFMGSLFSQNDSIIDVRDGRVYQTVQINNLWWMAENLNLGQMIISNTPGYQMSNNTLIEKYCWDNSDDYCEGAAGLMKKGGFYEWNEMTEYTTWLPEATTGLCPEGWRVPTYAEWNGLFANFGGGSTAATALLDGGNSGMDIKLTGYRCTFTGGFRPSAMSNDFMAYFWSSNDTDSENAPIIQIDGTGLTSFSFSKSLGLSIRCVKEAEQALNADFSASETFGYDELTTTFTDNSTGNPVSWLWNFGDGNTSTDQNPTHTYSSTGIFSVSLEISDGSQTVSLLKENYIVVETSSSISDINNNGGFLYQSTPNPASDFCKIEYRIAKADHVTLKIYDSAMQIVQIHSKEASNKLLSSFDLNISDLADGIYFYHLSSNDFTAVKKLHIIK